MNCLGDMNACCFGQDQVVVMISGEDKRHHNDIFKQM